MKCQSLSSGKNKETICLKYLNLFSEKNKKNTTNLLSAVCPLSGKAQCQNITLIFPYQSVE